MAGRDNVDQRKSDISDLRQRKNSKQKLEAGCLPLVETPIGMRPRKKARQGFATNACAKLEPLASTSDALSSNGRITGAPASRRSIALK